MSKYPFNEKKGNKAESKPSNRTVRDYGIHYMVLVLRICFYRMFEEDGCI